MLSKLGAWEPDSAGCDTGLMVVAKNCYPSKIGYGPMRGLMSYGGGTLPAACVGLFIARLAGGGWVAFAGTRTKLYKYVSGSWTDYSRLSGGDYSVPTDEKWSFAQFGSKLIAANFNDDPQVIDVDSGAANFAALAGSPPKARYVAVVGDFVFLAALATNPRKVMNSGLNDSEGWTIGTNFCDEQEFPDGGRVTGMAGGEYGYVFQEKAIRQTVYQPTPDIAFGYQRVDQEHGCAAGYGLTIHGGSAFFPADDGFYRLSPGTGLVPIGSQRVNQWFRDNSDPSRFFATQAFVDPYAPRVYWAFYSTSEATSYDRLLIYDWLLDRFTHADITAEIWATFATPGLTLEELDAYGSLEAVPYSLDSRVWEGGRPVIGAIVSGDLQFLEGAFALTATLTEAPRQFGGARQRMIVTELFPIGLLNDGTISARIGKQEHPRQSVTWTGSGTPSSLSGRIGLLASARLHHIEWTLSHTTGAEWRQMQAYDVAAEPDGDT